MSNLNKAAELFMEALGERASGMQRDRVARALRDLFGAERDLALGGLIKRLLGTSLAAQTHSWLADGPNEPLKPVQIAALFSEEAVGTFARSLDIDVSTACEGLAYMLPELIDRNSSGGELRAALDIVRRLRSVVQLFR